MKLRIWENKVIEIYQTQELGEKMPQDLSILQRFY